MTTLTINVIGIPVQQGSKVAGVTKAGRAFTREGRDR